MAAISKLLSPVIKTVKRAGWEQPHWEGILTVTTLTGETTTEEASPVKLVVVKDGVVQRNKEGEVRTAYNRKAQRILGQARMEAQREFYVNNVLPRLEQAGTEAVQATVASINAQAARDTHHNLTILRDMDANPATSPKTEQTV